MNGALSSPSRSPGIKRSPPGRRGRSKTSAALPTLADVLQALSDPVRLHIVCLAARRELACCEFGLELPKATLSHHFKVLRQARIIAVRTEGTRHLTTLNRRELDRRFPALIDAVLAAAN